MSKTLRIGIIGCLLGAGAMLGAGSAQAECIRAEVIVYWSGGTEQTVWPESYCIYDLGGDNGLNSGVDQTREGIPTGLPSGARVGVWVPD